MEEELEERYRPGLLDLNLQISVVKNFHHLDYQLQLTKKLEEEYQDFPATKCAILNLRGAIQFFLQNHEGSCETFKKVLEQDAVNLNALRNLEIIHRQLGIWNKADEYEKRSKEACGSRKGLEATYLGEQGFAMMFDCHISSNEYERFKRSKTMFQLCLEKIDEVETGDDVTIQIQWQLWYVQLLYKLLNASWDKDQKFSYVIEGLKLSLHVKEQVGCLERSSTDKRKCLSIATAYSGIFTHRMESIDSKMKSEFQKAFTDLQKKDGQKSALQEEPEPREHIKTASKEIIESKKDQEAAVKDVLKLLEDPESAFKKAVEMDENTEVLCRYALFLRGKRSSNGENPNEEEELKNLEEAEKLIDKCIQDKNGGNWFAYTIKAGINLAKSKPRYKRLAPVPAETSSATSQAKGGLISTQSLVTERMDKDATENAQPESTGTNDVFDPTLDKWLKKAINYGEKAGELNATSKIYSDLGEALHWHALNQKQDKDREMYFFKAVANFLHALQHAEGTKIPFVHYGHGKCLLDMKQYLPALESFKRAIECGTRRQKQAYKKLFKCYIELLTQTKNLGQTTNKEHLLSDLAYWIRKGNEKFKDEDRNWLGDIIDKLTKKVGSRPDEVAEIENTFAAVAKELGDWSSFHVSEDYLKKHVTFTLHIFGGTLQLQNSDFSKSCIEKLDGKQIRSSEESVQNIANSFIGCKEICSKSPGKEYLQRETFLIDTFKQLHQKCEEFAGKVADAIVEQKEHHLFGALLCHCIKRETTVEISDTSTVVQDMSSRELCLCIKLLSSYESDSQKFRDCLDAFEKGIEKISREQGPAGIEEHVTEPKVRKTKFKYDFCVIYSEKDADWVVHSLLPTLERKYGFHGYLEKRDLLPGENKFKVLEVFEKSYKVIVIVTDNFCEDSWCYYVFQQAMYGKLGEQSIIPIQKSKLKEMPKELQAVISLTAVHDLDHVGWERLVRELE